MGQQRSVGNRPSTGSLYFVYFAHNQQDPVATINSSFTDYAMHGLNNFYEFYTITIAPASDARKGRISITNSSCDEDEAPHVIISPSLNKSLPRPLSDEILCDTP